MAVVEPYIVRPLRDRDAIRTRLLRERIYAAYALGQLSPRLFGQVTCWEAHGDGGEALVLFSRGGLGDAVFMTGDPNALGAILLLHQGPRRNFATFREAHLPRVERFYYTASPKPMLRMAVTRPPFEPPSPRRWAPATVRRLSGNDTRAVNSLYNTEGAPAFYSAGHIEQGMYHGVFEGMRLVAVAGTHVIAPEEGVAVVGNVFTHPERRGLGYGTLVTGATTGALLAQCPDVVLTVDPTNTPAVRAYRRLGYREDCRMVESQVVRRSWTGLRAFVSARVAAWHGRTLGGEVVVRRR